MNYFTINRTFFLVPSRDISLLEDTIWCNERSVISETNTIDNYATRWQINFSAYTRLIENKRTTGVTQV